MNFLYVDSCSEKLFVLAFSDDNGTQKVATRTSTGNKKHNSTLLPFVDEVLQEIELDIKQVANIVCAVGPGSFTGIRLGVTTCNGLSFATGANRVAINTFEEVAYNITRHILVVIDARHGNYYGGEYDNGKELTLGNFTQKDLEQFAGEVIEVNGDRDVDKIIGLIKSKIANNDFVQMFSPLYLKKSQAERELKC